MKPATLRAPSTRKFPTLVVIGVLLVALLGSLVYSRQEAASLRDALQRATEHSAALASSATSAAWRLAGIEDQTEAPPPKPTFIAFEEEDYDEKVTAVVTGKDKDELDDSNPAIKAAVEVEEQVDLDDALAALSRCTNFECLASAHAAIGGRTRFNLPHFFLIGWQKCATSSVNHHFRSHPQYLQSVTKEPHFWTICQYGWEQKMCRANSIEDYLIRFLRVKDAAEMRLEAATVDASVDTAWKGEPLARKLHETFPWVKIVVMMREPISRMISWTRMWTQKGHMGKGCANKKSLFHCLRPHLGPRSFAGHYAEALEGWLRTFPADQIHIIQFEELQEDNEGTMRHLKEFLNMDPELPKTALRNVNNRGAAAGGGYPMKRKQYEALIDMVKPDAERVASLLGQYGLGNEKAWLARWQEVWDRQLATCDENNDCQITSN